MQQCQRDDHDCTGETFVLHDPTGPVDVDRGVGVASLCSYGDTIDEAEADLATAIAAHSGRFKL